MVGDVEQVAQRAVGPQIGGVLAAGGTETQFAMIRGGSWYPIANMGGPPYSLAPPLAIS